ncbi:MAG: hypothetical protein J1F64_02690 [Oscillospiraceae bacterium]|nr:hypothetical protein [Oscillospiraceae bacterium]
MFGFADLNFDFDGDGIPDSYADFIDSDNDGIIDTAAVDLNGDGNPDALLMDYNQDGMWDGMMLDSNSDGIFDMSLFDTDGDGIMDTLGMDSDYDGIIDSYHSSFDSDHDGITDTIVDGQDYNQDGIIESKTIYRDLDNDGIFEEVIKIHDSDGDGIADDIYTYLDSDGDGNEDSIIREQYFDSDGDGKIDTYVLNSDMDADHLFETTEIYNIDIETGAVELIDLPISDIGNVSGTYIDDLENFDPASADMSEVSGDPAQSMSKWEYQGDTGRCAIYSQKFVIEELTDQKVDIEELVDLAESNGWFDEDSGTSLLNMDKLLDFYGVQSEMSFYNDFSDLQRDLEMGKKIIVSIDADEIWYGENNDLFTPDDNANHAVEVIGVDHSDPDNTMVILNDSGNPNGCGEMVPLDVFLDAWEDGNCQMISCM